MPRRSISIVTACMASDGKPTFAVTEVTVSEEEAENGVHFYLAEADLFKAGFEEPFVHFDDRESPVFLHAAVRNNLGLPPASDQVNHLALTEAT